MAAGLVPLGDEPLAEDVVDVVGMLVMTGRVPPADVWADDLRSEKASASFRALL